MPESLPLSSDLQERLWQWAATYDATLNRANPASSGFPTGAERQHFIRQGRILQDCLQQELGHNFKVEVVGQD